LPLQTAAVLRVETMIARHDRHDTPAAVLFVIERSKALNDSFGQGR
jgi:hypothetical protein